MKYQIGDKVVIDSYVNIIKKSNHNIATHMYFGKKRIPFTAEMHPWMGMTLTIDDIGYLESYEYYIMKEIEIRYWWCEELFSNKLLKQKFDFSELVIEL